MGLLFVNMTQNGQDTGSEKSIAARNNEERGVEQSMNAGRKKKATQGVNDRSKG
jgi:hypothetical protein